LFLFVLLSNILGRLLPIDIAYWIAAFLILFTGIFFYLQHPEENILLIKSIFQWNQILAFGFLFSLFSMINFGLGIFDDFSNLPLTSMMATGDFPPHFYLNPEVSLDYHYGLHLLAASLIRIANFYPWSALDITKSLSISITIILSWLWYRRYIRPGLSLFLSSLLILFANGSRWLLLFFPTSLLKKMSEHITFYKSVTDTGFDMLSILTNFWQIDGIGPISFPFAFISGMFEPISMAMKGHGAFPVLGIFLLLLLSQRNWKPFSGLIFGSIIFTLALFSEQFFFMIFLGIAISILIKWLSNKTSKSIFEWVWVLIPSLMFTPFMGGAVLQVIRKILGIFFYQSSSNTITLPDLMFRFPPALISGHFGTLSISSPGHIIIALCEIGPIIFLAPFVLISTRDYIRSGKILMAGLSIMSIVSFFTPMIIQFTSRDRDITRLTIASLFVWLILAVPHISVIYKKSNHNIRSIIIIGYIIIIFGGLALFPSQLISIANPQASYFIKELDVIMTRQYWNQLEEEAKILDMNYVYRPAILFGRSTERAYEDVYTPYPEFISLIQNPDPTEISRAGYTYIYMDRKTWKNLNEENKSAFQRDCVKLIKEERTADGDFRRLLDIRNCSTED